MVWGIHIFNGVDEITFTEGNMNAKNMHSYLDLHGGYNPGKIVQTEFV